MEKNDASRRFREIEYVFLDRDGVINCKPPEGKYISRWEEVELLPGAAAAIAELNRTGRKVIVATNQRGIALGLMTVQDLSAIHERLGVALADEGARLDAIYFCPHDNNVCDCRKPGTGMIDAAFRDFPAAARPVTSVFVGDSLSDIECGRRAGMATVYIAGEGCRQKAGWEIAAALADAVADSLSDCVTRLIG